MFRVSCFRFSALVPRLRRPWPLAAPAAGSHLSGTKTSASNPNCNKKCTTTVLDKCRKRSHCFRRARFASASASCRALPALRFSASDSWRRSKAAAAAAAVAARCASAARAEDILGTKTVSAVFRVSLFGGSLCFVFHFLAGSGVSCFTFPRTHVFHVFRVSAGRVVKHRRGLTLTLHTHP